MSKSVGNIIDPEEEMSKFGADAVRFYMLNASPVWTPLRFDEEGVKDVNSKILGTLKNTYTFFEMYANTDNVDPREFDVPYEKREEIDKWLLSKYNKLVKNMTEAFDEYDLNKVTKYVFTFLNEDLSNWYIRRNRRRFWGSELNDSKKAVYKTTYEVLTGVCKLLAPIIPFITEEIWQKVKGFVGITADSIMLQPFPQVEENGFDPEAEAEIEWLKEVIVAVRNIRAESNIAPSKGLDLLFRNLSAENAKILEKQTALLKAMAKLDNVQVLAANETAPLAVAKLVGNAELLVPMAGFINKEAELARLTKEIEKYQNEVKRIENKLSNEAFVAKAPEAVIAKEREKQAEYQSGLEKIQEQYKAIEAL